jgi:glutamate synthase domain-containing protein 1
MDIKVDFKQENGGFSVVFWRKLNQEYSAVDGTQNQGNDVDEQTVIGYINNYGYINRQQLISLLNISKSSAIRIFNKMVKTNQIASFGGSKNTIYKLAKHDNQSIKNCI